MWPFRRPQHDTEPTGVIYEGRFWYAGGLPGYDAADSFWRAARVVVAEDGLTYRKSIRGSWRNAFAIPVRMITGVGRTKTVRAENKFPVVWANFATVEMEYSGRPFVVRFRLSQEKTTVALLEALNVMLAPQRV